MTDTQRSETIQTAEVSTAVVQPARTFSVDWWYRHSSDSERTIRQHPQMGSAVASTAELDATIRDMRRQGYDIQRITLQAICPRCQANGRIVVRKYKRQPPKYATCPTCKGDGHVGAVLEWPIPAGKEQ